MQCTCTLSGCIHLYRMFVPLIWMDSRLSIFKKKKKRFCESGRIQVRLCSTVRGLVRGNWEQQLNESASDSFLFLGFLGSGRNRSLNGVNGHRKGSCWLYHTECAGLRSFIMYSRSRYFSQFFFCLHYCTHEFNQCMHTNCIGVFGKLLIMRGNRDKVFVFE